MDVDARVEALEARNERLLEQIARLEAALGLDLVAPLGWGLTVQEGRLLGALVSRDVVTKDAGMAALYRDFGKDEPDPKILDVFICKMRPKLRRAGVEIETVWGVGYRIAAEGRQVVRAAMPGAPA